MADAALVEEVIRTAIREAGAMIADDLPLLILQCRAQAYVAAAFEDLHDQGLIGTWQIPHVHVAPGRNDLCIHVRYSDA